jgi:hypothetical protein
LRIGYTTTGSQNSAAGGAQGLECDRFSPAAARLQFDSWFGLALQKVGPQAAGKVLHVLHVDSWEAGSQNWSPEFAAGFARLRGYQLLPYIAVLTGVPVTSADVAERVLLDVRRTINDLMQAGFYEPLAQLAHEQGCLFSAEPPSPTFPCDGLQHYAQVDWPMGEFWLRTPRNDKPTDIKDAVCGARLYGKRAAAAEAFTQGLMQWDEHPFTFKALGDSKYCAGINRFMLHVYAHQPWLDRAPGMTLNGIGAFFSRTQTWWRPARAWFDYLRRCQALLQEGQAVAEICYFTGENIPARSLLPRQLSLPLPDGYAYDCINRDALLRLAEVHDGWIVLKSGARYRVLVLPDDVSMTREVALKLRELVRAGARVVGPRPERSPSLTGFPGCDDVVREVAQELWGKGRIASSQSLGALLTELSLPPDFEAKGATPVRWTHRRGAGWDLYFLSNPSDSALDITATFRLTGRQPQLWHPDRGQVETPPSHVAAGRTVVPLSLDPAGSVFVVFAAPARVAQPVRSSLEQAVLGILGPWQVRFADRMQAAAVLTLGQLASWTEQSNEHVKYYSGTALYTVGFEWSRDLMDWSRHASLDLGVVHDLVEVRLNGVDLGVLWKPPFRVAITGVLRPGQNRLELAVTNTWRNRIIGDYGKPDSERKTFVLPRLRKGKEWLPGGPGTELSPAGLLGPVRILC